MVAAVSISGCFGPPVVPVSERSTAPVRPPVRVVREGDTLYSIAWEFQLDWQTLARWNQIAPPYLIYPNQRISLYAPTASPPSPPPPVVTAPASAAAPTPTAAAAAVAKAPATRSSPTPVPIALTDPKHWLWPAEGQLLHRYSPQDGIMGIQIGGRPGEPVRAAAAGQVVYAGSGLRGYGNLVIVKHSDRYLSAYAHNRRLLVKEGDLVRAGQEIAEMGSTGATVTMLHFEIRDNGNPVNPLTMLPSRHG